MSHLNYLNSPYTDNFKELCAAMPLFYLDVFEMREILKVQGRLMDDVCDSFELILANNFIIHADEATIKKLERALHITYEDELTLEQRKQAIIARITGYGHIGEQEIRAIIACYTKGCVSVAFAKGVIYLEIEGEIPGEATLYETLLARIPAHLRLGMQINVRRTFRQQINFSYGSEIITKFNPKPVGEDRTARSTLSISFGGEIFTDFKPQPVGEDREVRTGLRIAQGGFIESRGGEVQLDAQMAYTERSNGTGGLYYHTHTKSKLIE